MEELYIDIGATSQEEASSRLEIGDAVVFGGDFEPLMGQFATARNFDNRMGCFVVAEALRKLAQTQASYLQWVLDSDFPADTKKLIRDALAGNLAEPAARG